MDEAREIFGQNCWPVSCAKKQMENRHTNAECKQCYVPSTIAAHKNALGRSLANGSAESEMAKGLNRRK